MVWENRHSRYSRFNIGGDGDAPKDWTLTSYGENEGPEYPRANKRGDVGAFFRALQTKELYACTKNIFAPVKTKYDASAENLARFNREYSLARFNRVSLADAKRSVQALIDDATEKTKRFAVVRASRTRRVLTQVLSA